MSKNIVFEGWLTKSPPTKRIWRTKWRRRWFALRQSGELPGQYFLDYYADPNCKRPKGTINLDLCEQVDAGLHMERTGSGSLDPKLRGSVFTIQTQSRTYHLEADCEADMAKWVDAICRVCGLRATDEPPNPMEVYQNSVTTVDVATITDDYECSDTTSSYIPISECVTGFRSLEQQTTFTFNPNSIVLSTRPPLESTIDNRHHMYTSNPQIRINNVELSENESTLSEDECKSLNASQPNIPEWSVAKSFTKLAVHSNTNGNSEQGPPVPPRPPKTLTWRRDVMDKDSLLGSKVQETAELHENNVAQMNRQAGVLLGVPQRTSYGAPSSPGPSGVTASSMRTTDDEEECSPANPSLQYCNLPSQPPAVDRALKPRLSNHSIGRVSHITGQTTIQVHHTEIRTEATLQYSDLDLQTSEPSTSSGIRRKTDIIHGRSLSSTDNDSYKTVDFVKTEAFNITRQDAEALRSSHQ